MSSATLEQTVPAPLLDERVLNAWQRTFGEPLASRRVEALKVKRKSLVYRIQGASRHGGSIIAKRSHSSSAVVERTIYEEILPTMPVPALRCLGFDWESNGEFCWLFLEDAGSQAYVSSNPVHRMQAGQWLGATHRTRVPEPLQARLPDRGLSHYWRELEFIRQRLFRHRDHPELSAVEAALIQTCLAHCDTMETHWDELRQFCDRWPRTLVHGDFVMKNMRMLDGNHRQGLLVFDWEMAGWGIPAADLAQFVGRSSSPNLAAYSTAFAQEFPRCHHHAVRRLAQYGNVLRLLDKIYWEALSMEEDSYRFLSKPLMLLKVYEPQLGASLSAVHWRGV